MLPRISRCVVALLIAAGVFAGVAEAQHSPPPLGLTSLEALVADSDVVARGIVVDVATDRNWNVVTLDVRETLKGTKAKRLIFAAYQYEKGNALLAQAKQSKHEQVWILKRQPAGVAGQAPDREKLLARHKIDLYAPFLPGRPGSPALPMIALGENDDQAIAFLTVELRLLKTSDDIVQAIRAAIDFKSSTGSHSISLPQEIAERTGFSRAWNLFEAPLDSRLEALARRLVRNPGEFLSKKDADPIRMLRLEGVKTLRLFPSEKNLAIVRAWLDDPMSTQPLQGNRQTLVPAIRGNQPKPALPADLAQVPEIHFQQPLTKAMKTEDAQLHTAVTIDSVHLMNQKKTDAFIETLMSKRPDLAGLSFAMGDACRMKPEAGRKFVKALEVFRKAESMPKPPQLPGPPIGFGSEGNAKKEPESKKKPDPEESFLMRYYVDLAKKEKIDPSANVASLMQVLAPEDAKTQLGMVTYLEGLPHVDATHALAKLAIFSTQSEVGAAAVAALKKRDAKDYRDILVAGLSYPWPAVAVRASEAMVTLERKDLIPRLIDVLEKPDPRSPQTQERDGKKVAVVRELVRLNHHHNCLLCHAPAPATRDNITKEEAASLEGLTAQVPVPSESMVAYYRPSNPDILVRFDVTYLRQDFSMKIKVANADPWPEMQRYDFLVRTREVSETEASALRDLLPAASPYRSAALSALRGLTGQDTAPTAQAWRRLTGL